MHISIINIKLKYEEILVFVFIYNNHKIFTEDPLTKETRFVEGIL